MRVNNNPGALSVAKWYQRATAGVQDSMKKLSSGQRILKPSDDAAGLAISEKFRSQARNSAMASNNVDNARAFLQTADGWMQNVHDMLGRMSELAIEANDGTKTADDISNLNDEFTALQTEINNVISSRATYNTAAVFGAATRTIQVGPDNGQTFTSAAIDLATDLAGTAGLSGVDDATAVTTLAADIATLAGNRAAAGSELSQLEFIQEGLQNYIENISAAESQIRDVDVAAETVKFSKFQILSQTSTAMLAQANSLPQNVLSLLR